MPQLAVFPKGYLDELIVHKTMSIFEWIGLARTLPVVGLEMHVGFFTGLGEAEIDRAVGLCAEAGLAIPMLGYSPDYTHPDRAARLAELEKHKRAIDFIARLGGRYCRALSGQNRPGLDHAQAVRGCVEMLRAAADYAGERGIVLNMENHYKDGYWDYPEFALMSEVFLEIVDQIDSPAFGHNYDPSNAIVAGEDPLLLLKTIKRRVVTMHASDRNLKGGTLADLRKFERDPLHGYARSIQHGVIGQGLNDYDAIFSELSGAGFDGWISIEDGVNGIDELQQSAAFLNAKIKQHFGAGG